MEESFKFDFEAIGTSWKIEFSGKKSKDLLLLRKKIDQEIKNFSKIFSRFDTQSEISKAGLFKRKIEIPKKYLELIEIYKKLYDLTYGSFTPMIGNLLVEAGYDSKYSLIAGKLNPVLRWDEVIDFTFPFLNIKKPWILDFGAGGKGFLVDLIGKLFDDFGIRSYCIDASGDILFKSLNQEKIKIGLEHPEKDTQVIGVAQIRNQSICATAGNRRKWGEYHHIFDPYTLKSVSKVLAVWVTAKKAFIADCLATCLFLVDPKILEKIFKFEYLIVYPDLTFKKSPHFEGEIYYNE